MALITLAQKITKIQKNFIFFLTANFISLFFGLIIVIKLSYFSEEYLGIFIFQYTFFLLLGNLLTAGQHIFLLNKLSQLKSNLHKKNYLKNNLFSSLIPPIIGLFSILLLERVIDSIYLNKLGINKIYIIIGCFFFSINKILFNVQNGFNFFYNLSFLIILRAFFFISAIFFILFNELSIIDNLSFVFLFSELFLFLIYIFFYLILKKKIKVNFKIYIRNIKNGIKLFGEFFFSDLILKVDILLIVYLFNFKEVSIYALTMVMIEGILAVLVVFRNFFTSEYGHLIYNKNYIKYLFYRKKYGLIFFGLKTFLIISGYVVLLILNKYLFNIENQTFYFYFIITPSLLIYSFFINSEYIFSIKNNFNLQTQYFIKAIIFQVAVLFLLYKNYSIYSFPISISLMFMFMSINLYFETKNTK